MTQSDICMAVNQLKNRYDESDPFRLCRAMDILLLPQPLGTHSTAIKGFYMRCKRIRSITVNSDLPEVIQRIIAAHELGHAVLHQDEAVCAFHELTLFDQASDLEREANLFAAELLLDDETVLDVLCLKPTFFDAAAQLMVPREILDFKLRLLRGKGYNLTDSPIQSSNNFLGKLSGPVRTNGFDLY